jgi:hypothetical protein
MRTISIDREYSPVEGKTYNLFAYNQSTEYFYKEIDFLITELLAEYLTAQNLLQNIRQLSSSKKQLVKLFDNQNGVFESLIIKKLYQHFSKYTLNTSEHLKQLPLTKKIWDKRLNTSELQYHLYIIEFELTNRINKENFFKCEHKYAFLPHCLRDLSKECKSESDGFDYVCKHCSKTVL